MPPSLAVAEDSNGFLYILVGDLGDGTALEVMAWLPASDSLEVGVLSNPTADALGEGRVVHSFEQWEACRTDHLVDPGLQRLWGVREGQREGLPESLNDLFGRGLGLCGFTGHLDELITVPWPVSGPRVNSDEVDPAARRSRSRDGVISKGLFLAGLAASADTLALGGWEGARARFLKPARTDADPLGQVSIAPGLKPRGLVGLTRTTTALVKGERPALACWPFQGRCSRSHLGASRNVRCPRSAHAVLNEEDDMQTVAHPSSVTQPPTHHCLVTQR